jgi:hypothetical protein
MPNRPACAGPRGASSPELFTLAGVAALWLAAGVLRAQGGPPLVTDDPGTPGNRNWEINLAFTFESQSSERVFEAPLIDANYGLGERTQLKVEIPWLVQDVSGEPGVNGAGNTLLGVKYRFVDEDRAGVALAVYPQVELRTSASSVRSGLVEEGTGAILPLIAQKRIGPVSADVEIGPVVRSGQKPRWFGGLAVGGDVTEGLDLAAEVFVDTSSQFSDSNASVNAGGRWKLGRHFVSLFSAGTGIHGSEDRPRFRLLTYLGLQLLL